ncbi:hypothetical protein [Winogradskyella forsetii]|uniref:hypothetical protein n=1 Tax=Winogradskyella forsetii TaxID=2686077 RepID=UPI001E2D4A01|nr:hypothetical protein [Winogradskyella forsetii]
MIEPNAESSEKQSPFYLKNELFCKKFEDFISQHDGNSKGKYNAWSYLVYGKIIKPKEWALEYKKSTFTSGNLFLSTKSQSLFVSAIWKTRTNKAFKSDFLIRKKKFTDSILKLVNQSIKKIESHQNYILITNRNSFEIQNLIQVLQPLFITNEIYQITYQKNILTIDLRTEKHYFDIFSKLIELSI